MTDLDDFNFDNWVSKHGIIRASSKILSDQHLNTKEALLEADRQDIAKIGLAVGQEVIVRRGLRDLGNLHFQEAPLTEKTATSTQEDDSTDPRSTGPGGSPPLGSLTAQQTDLLIQAGADLDALLNNSSGRSAPNLGVGTELLSLGDLQSKPETYDPRHLLTLKSTTRKAEKIASFLPEKVKERLQRTRRERLVFTEGQDGRLSLQQGEDSPFSISPTEWGAANMRLMSHLLAEGQLNRTDVEYYMAYTMQVFELADTYEWHSVMRFDSRYRELQAHHGFPWGDMRLALQLNLLTPRSFQNTTVKPRNFRPNAKIEDCKKWLLSGGTSCPFGDKCRFVHRRSEDPSTAPKNGQT